MEIDNISLLRLEAGSVSDVKIVLKELIEKNTERFSFPELNQDNKRKKLWNMLFSHLERSTSANCHAECLIGIRMLSRDKTDIDKLMNEKWVDLLLYHAGLEYHEHEQYILMWHNLTEAQYQIMVEALKALCNLTFNSERVQSICKNNRCMEMIVMRLKLFKEPYIPYSIKYFDVRMLFIITALCPDTRETLKSDYHALIYLMEILDLIINEASVEGSLSILLNQNQVSLVSEVLKVLFNLMVKTGLPQPQLEEEEDSFSLRLEGMLKSLLLCKTQPPEIFEDLLCHTVNILTTVPGTCHKELISDISPNKPSPYDFRGKNMETFAILLDYLDKRLNCYAASGYDKWEHDLLLPILNVSVECAVSHPLTRKFMRMRILPPLRDIRTRPEEGDKLRNKLCRLLTSPATNIRDLVAELLFVLCKEKVSRMIKYTGYGNAAGMFANRGLLGNKRLQCSNFSSDSEDSDTDEYKQFKHRINPVVGCYEPERPPGPLQSMTDEEKEFQAVMLVNMMDNLSRKGIIQPCKIDESGKPQPVDHVLELQEELKRQQIRNDNTTDDDDY